MRIYIVFFNARPHLNKIHCVYCPGQVNLDKVEEVTWYKKIECTRQNEMPFWTKYQSNYALFPMDVSPTVDQR